MPVAGKCLGVEFGTERVVTQGTPISPIIYNIVLGDLVKEVLDVICSQQEAHHGMVWADGEINLVFYADCVRIAGRYHEGVQYALVVAVGMLRMMVIDSNLEKTNTMIRTYGFIWGTWREVAYKQRATGEGATFTERKNTQLSFTECGVTVVASYLKAHMALIHDICVPQMRGFDKVGGGGGHVWCPSSVCRRR